MKQYVLHELGLFTEKEAKKIVELANNKTYMNFKVGYSNCYGNCSIILKTDERKETAKAFFCSYLIRTLLGREK